MTGLPILMYHSLDTSGSVISTSPSWFRATMAALHAEGFACVDLNDWISAGRPAVERGFALTFDDGLASLTIAAETMAHHGFSATAFLVAGRMGRDNGWAGVRRGIPSLALLDWSDLAALRDAGIRFGAHTMSHPYLGVCDKNEMEREILHSRESIEDHTGVPCPLFSYPYGDAPASARTLVKRRFSAGFGTRLAFAPASEDHACLSRVDAYYLRSPRNLERFISGRWSGYLRARRTARAVRRTIAVARSAASGYGSAPDGRR
ncbi:MAG: putative xylanase/chitin deacetylase [Planctomycetota bacterium]|nr:putative xylanase/chitin deacetylase [Planctomycetota bacterium]